MLITLGTRYHYRGADGNGGIACKEQGASLGAGHFAYLAAAADWQQLFLVNAHA